VHEEDLLVQVFYILQHHILFGYMRALVVSFNWTSFSSFIYLSRELRRLLGLYKVVVLTSNNVCLLVALGI